MINEANGILRDLDLVYVSASGNTNWKVDLTLADGQLDLSQELQNRLTAPRNAREQGLADTFGGVSTLGQLNYNAIRDRQYSTISSFLTEVRLPSSGYPDMAYVHAAAAALPRLDQHYQGSDHQLSRVWANLSGDEKTRIAASSVDLGNVAAKPNFASWENAFLSSAANVAWAKSLQPGQDLNGDGKADTNGFQDWFVRGHELPDDWEAWTKNLSDSERAKLEEVYRNNRQSVLVAVGDNVSGFLDRGVDWINDPFGDQKNRPKDFLSVARDDVKGIFTGIPRMAAQGVENGLTELGTWSQIAVGSMGAAMTGDTRVLQNALPTGGDWSSKFPITTGAVQNAEGFLDRWGSAIQGDTSKLRATYGQGKIASTLAQDLGAILPFAAMFRRVPKELSTTMRGVTGPLTRPNRLELPSLVPGTMVGPTRTGLGDIGHLALGPLASLRPRPLNELGDLAGSVQRALPQRAPRIVDEKFRAEVGARSIDELTSGLRGDPRFHVWEYAGQTFVRRGHPDESWMRNELGDAQAPRQGAPTRQHVADILDRAGWPEAIRDGKLDASKIDQLADGAVFREIEAAMRAQAAGEIVGMKDWLQFNGVKGFKELAEAAAELSIARRLVAENPGMVVKVGLENTPRISEKTGKRLREFDIAVQTPEGKVLASIEVKALQNAVKGPTDLTEGVTHAVEKVENRQGTEHPVEGSPEARVHIKLDVGVKKSRKQTTEILKDGTVIRTRPDGQLIGTSNIYDKFAEHLTENVPRSMLIDRVTIVDQFGESIVLVRHGSTWTKQ